jgi:hypothetical protein
VVEVACVGDVATIAAIAAIANTATMPAIMYLFGAMALFRFVNIYLSIIIVLSIQKFLKNLIGFNILFTIILGNRDVVSTLAAVS